MSLRRIAALLLVFVAACAKDVQHEATPAFIDYSVFDPSASAIPLPNDLALATAATLSAGAQRDLLLAFAAQGGFPNDIEVPVTIDFTRMPVGPGASSAPTLDPASIRPIGDPKGATVALFKLTAAGPVPAAFDAAAVTQTQHGTRTTLELRAPRAADGSRNWEAGAHYAVAVRGGPNGVMTSDGHQVSAMPAMFLLLAGKNLADPANQSLLPDPSAGAQLEQIRQSYLPVFMMLDAGGAAFFPSSEIANVQTFQVAPAAGTYVRVDSTAGVVPLPFDLLRTDPDGTIIFNPAFGPAAAGLDLLDGFSTTAMMMAPTSAPIDASTVTGANVFLFKLPAGSAPVLVKDLQSGGLDGYLLEPPPITTTCTIAGTAGKSCAGLIGLQPAVQAGAVSLPPLAENTEYAVVITKGVMDAGDGTTASQPLVRSTIAKIILDVADPVAVNGVSQLAGVDDATATMLERMRTQLAAVYPLLPGGKTVADVAMAYTFKTQSITPTAIQLAQLPYSAAAASLGTVTANTSFTAAQASTDYGVPSALLPAAAVPEVDEATFYTLDLLNPGNQGAFDPANPTPTAVTAVVAVPPAAAVTGACPAGVSANPATKCAPLVIFHHGITRSRGDMLLLAASFTSRGFIVAAIDAAKHGERSYCSADAQCVTGDHCVPIPALGTPVDAVAPGVCETASGAPGQLQPSIPGAPKSTPVASGNYLVSLNLFRTRDTLRQDIVDQTFLALALARPVALRTPGAALDPFASHLETLGIAVDPTQVYYVGQSLGAMQGVLNVATNPRITRAVLAEGGATAIDIFANPASGFHASLVALLGTATPPIVEGTPQYLQFLQIAKWVLDPADPANFAGTLLGDPAHPRLAISLPFAPAQPAQILDHAALCDDTIPNTQNELLAGLVGIPVPPIPPTAATNGYFEWFSNPANGVTAACPSGGAATHGVLIDWVDQALTNSAQTNAAAFLATGAAQPTPVVQ